MKHSKKDSEKKRETWTFQPSDDVKDMVKSLGIKRRPDKRGRHKGK